MFRFFTAHIADLPFPSRKKQTRNVKTGFNGIIESEHIYDIGYITHRVADNSIEGDSRDLSI
jgi:hypothetical protein